MVLPAGLVGERTGDPDFARAGCAADNQIDRLADPFSGAEMGEFGARDAASGAARDIREVGPDAQLRAPQPCLVASGVLEVHLALQQHRQAVLEAEFAGAGQHRLLFEGFRHAAQSQPRHAFQGGMIEGHPSPPWPGLR